MIPINVTCLLCNNPNNNKVGHVCRRIDLVQLIFDNPDTNAKAIWENVWIFVKKSFSNAIDNW